MPDFSDYTYWRTEDNINKIKRVEIEGSVTSVGAYAFAGCRNLTQIELPKGVTSIGENAFSGCRGLTQIELPEGVTSIGEGAFESCEGLERIELPEGVTSIGDYAFTECRGLTQIELPKDLTSIGDYAFCACIKLERIELPKGLTSIGRAAFTACGSLTELVFTSLIAPTLGKDAFVGAKINTIYIPAGAEGYTKEYLKNAGLSSSCEQKLLYTITVQKTEGGEAYASPALALAGEEITLTSKPKDGWHFKEWRAVSENVEIDENRFIMPEEHVEIQPVFEQDPVTIAASASPAEGGTVSGGGTYHKNESVTVRASAADGWRFVKWTEGGSEAAADADYTFPASGDRSLTAVFERSTVNVAVSASPAEGGTVNGGGTYYKNESVTVRASAADGWRFVKWTEGGSEAAADADYTFTAAGDRSLTAVFEKTAADSSGSGSGGTGSGSGGTGSGSTGGGSGGTDSTRQPYIKDSAGRTGWDAIQAEAEKAAAAPEGGTINVDMNGVSSVPGSVLAAVKGRDVTLIFDMGGGVAWSVNGKDITAETVSSTDFSVKAGAGEIPQAVLSAAAGSSAHIELRFAYNGAFGFTAQLSLRLAGGNGGSVVIGSGNGGSSITGSSAAGSLAGMYANLFYYHPQLRRLEFVCAGRIAEDGTVRLPLAYTAGSGYTLILSAQPMNGTDAPQEPPKAPDETEPEDPQEPEEPAKAQVKSVKLSKTVYTYSGKAKKPSVTAADTDGKRISSKYYTVSYKNNKNVGKATVTVKFKGSYSGTVKKTFTIRPAGTSIKKLTPATGGFTVRWAGKTAQTSGYQIQYSTDAGFLGSGTHSRFARKASLTKHSVKKLKTGKTYYVRIRTYKTVKTGGKSVNIYSAWSSAAKVKTAGAASGAAVQPGALHLTAKSAP